MANPTPEQIREWMEGLPDRTKALLGLAVAGVLVVMGFVLVATDSIPGLDPDPTTTTTDPTTSTTGDDTTTTDPPVTGVRLSHLDNPAGVPMGPKEINGETVDPAILTQEEIDVFAFTEADPFTAPISPQNNGRSPQGQFRKLCTVSHFSTEDPVVFPDQPGEGHLHMFFGNLEADAFSTGSSLLESGETTCQGDILNRSAYWMPAMVDGDGSVVMPEAITLYYKSHRPQDVSGVFPEGAQMVAGLEADGAMNPTFAASERLSWGCYNGSSTTAIRNTIPGTVSAPCPAGQPIQATLQFPQCFAVDEAGEVVTTSANLVDHAVMLFDERGNYGRQGDPCPSSHPYRVPQISYLVRWATVVDGRPVDVSGWQLSSDESMNAEPGGSLHADWLGAWHEASNQEWIDGCFQPTPFNCSLGQTNGPRGFARLLGDHLVNMEYRGPQLLPIDPP